VAGNEIINPAQSARMVSSDSFSFTYGTIEVRAKMPKGDWIWPGRNEFFLSNSKIIYVKSLILFLKQFGCCPLMKFTVVGHDRVRLTSLNPEVTPISRAMVLR
jgi:hypothetical protein